MCTLLPNVITKIDTIDSEEFDVSIIAVEVRTDWGCYTQATNSVAIHTVRSRLSFCPVFIVSERLSFSPRVFRLTTCVAFPFLLSEWPLTSQFPSCCQNDHLRYILLPVVRVTTYVAFSFLLSEWPLTSQFPSCCQNDHLRHIFLPVVRVTTYVAFSFLLSEWPLTSHLPSCCQSDHLRHIFLPVVRVATYVTFSFLLSEWPLTPHFPSCCQSDHLHCRMPIETDSSRFGPEDGGRVSLRNAAVHLQ
jgi:hypothetical protein